MYCLAWICTATLLLSNVYQSDAIDGRGLINYVQTVCEDNHYRCSMWALQHHCQLNFMKVFCCATCKFVNSKHPTQRPDVPRTRRPPTTRSRCSRNQFDCENGRCIPRAYLCDGDNDCRNNKDEEHPQCHRATQLPTRLPTTAAQPSYNMTWKVGHCFGAKEAVCADGTVVKPNPHLGWCDNPGTREDCWRNCVLNGTRYKCCEFKDQCIGASRSKPNDGADYGYVYALGVLKTKSYKMNWQRGYCGRGPGDRICGDGTILNSWCDDWNRGTVEDCWMNCVASGKYKCCKWSYEYDQCYGVNGNPYSDPNSTSVCARGGPKSTTRGPPGEISLRSPGKKTRNGRAYAGIVYLRGRPICDDSFGSVDANVACKMAGFARASMYSGSQSIGRKDFILDDIDCVGSEMSLFGCHHNGINYHNCGSTEGVYVECM